MKTLLRNVFWLIMISWSLLLNDLEILGIIVAIFTTVYICYNIKNLNYWRVISLFLTLSFIGYLCISLSNIMSIYTLLFPFLLVMNLNTALVNEICLKLKKNSITLFFTLVSLCMIVFFTIILILPEIPMIGFYKSNLVLLTSLIFIPSFMVLSVNAIIKLYGVNVNKQRMYN